MTDPETYELEGGSELLQMVENVTEMIHTTNYTNLHTQNTFINALTIARNIYVPSIIIVGLAGNFVSLAVFTASQLRHVSSSGYLAALACADNLFLLSLMVTWLDGSIVPILVSKEACQFIIFITYISSFLSVWYVVCFTSERYIAICHPLHAPMIFSKLREKFVVIFFVLISAVLYNFALWTTESKFHTNRNLCFTNHRFFQLMQIVTWIDTALTMVLPFLLILFMNVRIVWRVIRYQRKRENVLQTHKSERTPALKNKSQMRITRTLLLVSTTFLVLNLPSHVLRLEQLISASTRSDPLLQKLIQEVTQLIYYTNFSVNFFLYAIYGKHFKKSLKMLVTNMCRRRKALYRDRCRSDFNRTSSTSMQAYSR